jgi:hypothetical protein
MRLTLPLDAWLNRSIPLGWPLGSLYAVKRDRDAVTRRGKSDTVAFYVLPSLTSEAVNKLIFWSVVAMRTGGP